MSKWISTLRALAALLSLVPHGAWSQATSGLNPYIAESWPMLLRHVTVIYGRQQAPGRDFAVLIRDGRISWMGPDGAGS